ncbi:MAG: AAA family ATPase, partial [Pseudomonadales bacterium]
EAVIKNGFNLDTPYRAAVNLMLRKPPTAGKPGQPLKLSSETTVEAACRIGKTLNGDVLGIQGPPGTGKTFTGGEMICELIKQGKTVGVTAVSHKVVLNLLEGAMKAAKEKSVQIKCVHKQSGPYEGDYDIQAKSSYPAILAGLKSGEINLLGGTAWQWSREDFAQSVDVLIVDEAGQMSLSNVLATSQAGQSLVLLGDPQQLEQPLQSSHPEDSEVSALHHLLDGAETMPDHLGLFLEETWRLHPDIT